MNEDCRRCDRWDISVPAIEFVAAAPLCRGCVIEFAIHSKECDLLWSHGKVWTYWTAERLTEEDCLPPDTTIKEHRVHRFLQSEPGAQIARLAAESDK